MCPQPEMMTRPKKNMDIKLYRRIIEKNSFIWEVDLFNWGEPLIHPEIDQFIQ
jgi:hypothetical protein